MKEKLQALKAGVKNKAAQIAVGVGIAMAGGAASAQTSGSGTFDFPTAMQPVFDSTTANATALGTKAIAAAVIVWGIYIGFRIGRKLVNKVA